MKLLAVTVLTSLDRADLEEQGITGRGPTDLVVHRARLAKAAGFDGVVASGQEARLVREAVGPGFLIVTPGIRLAEGPDRDQARVMTPANAIGAGARALGHSRSRDARRCCVRRRQGLARFGTVAAVARGRPRISRRAHRTRRV